MASLMRKIIIPPGVSPRALGTLLTSTPSLPPEQVEENGVPRWIQGIGFQSLGFDPLTTIETIVCSTDWVTDKVARDLQPNIGFDSFTFYDAIQGAVLCDNVERMDGDLEIRMPAMVSEQFALELMSGASRTRATDVLEGTGYSIVNPNFVDDATVVAGGPYEPLNALSLLEQAAADTHHGAQSYLHLTPRGMSYLNGFEHGEPIDNRWTTAQGHVVIGDAGYLGPEPTANGGAVTADEWWYASGPVFWAMTQPMSLGLPFERIEYSTNQLTNILEGYGLIVFDPAGVVAVPVSYPVGS